MTTSVSRMTSRGARGTGACSTETRPILPLGRKADSAFRVALEVGAERRLQHLAARRLRQAPAHDQPFGDLLTRDLTRLEVRDHLLERQRGSATGHDDRARALAEDGIGQ